jgi:choline kinase
MTTEIKCVILAAGRGRRLEAITHARYPKCLVRLKGKTLLQRQIEAARAEGLNDILVVTGYKPETVEKITHDLDVETLWNPLSEYAENILSLAIVRNLRSDLIIINGDVLIPREALPLLLSTKQSALVIDKWSIGQFDAEAMKVSMNGPGWITSISKSVTRKHANGEYIGIGRIRSRDMRLLRVALSEFLSSGTFWTWYESAFDMMVRRRKVLKGCFLPAGCPWAEIDTPAEYRQALKLLEYHALELW